MSSASDLSLETNEQAALASYLSAVVAIGNCMGEVCPAVGTMYRDRLLKLPRRLGFDATPQALEQSREAVETDLLEYAITAKAWIQARSNHAAELMVHLRATEETLVATADLQTAFLEDMADHIATSAEVDDEAQLRMSFQRYAAGLRAYSRRARTEKLNTITELQRRREEMEAWLAGATTSNFTDPETCLLNRAAAERRLETEIAKDKPFCVILVAWAEDGAERLGNAHTGQIMKQLGEQLAATVRPYDLIFRWSQDQLLTIFEAREADIAARAKQIAGWLGEVSYTLEVGGQVSVVKTHTMVSVVEYLQGDPASKLIARIESIARQEAAVR